MNFYRGKVSFGSGNHSTIEVQLMTTLHRLYREGVLLADFLTDEWISIYEESDHRQQQTQPDLWFSTINFPVYLDGPPHKKKRASHRDAVENSALEKKGMLPLRLEYTINTKVVRERFIEQILVAVNEKVVSRSRVN